MRIGTIVRAQSVGRDIALDYVYDPTIQAISNAALEEMSAELGFLDWEFSRTHWAVKDADIFRSLLRRLQPRRNRPRVFSLLELPKDRAEFGRGDDAFPSFIRLCIR